MSDFEQSVFRISACRTNVFEQMLSNKRPAPSIPNPSRQRGALVPIWREQHLFEILLPWPHVPTPVTTVEWVGGRSP